MHNPAVDIALRRNTDSSILNSFKQCERRDNLKNNNEKNDLVMQFFNYKWRYVWQMHVADSQGHVFSVTRMYVLN